MVRNEQKNKSQVVITGDQTKNIYTKKDGKGKGMFLPKEGFQYVKYKVH